jgi:hypothetical protein
MYIYVIIISLFLLLLLFILSRYYANGYIGINNAPCSYCKLFRGTHYHYVSPTKYEKRYNDASMGKMCEICLNYPGQMHFHLN